MSTTNLYKQQRRESLLQKKGIFVTKEGKKIPVKKLYIDESGKIYYKEQYFAKGYTQDVPCQNGCGNFFGIKCPKCGWPEKKKK